jgi:hypothetical protein
MGLPGHVRRFQIAPHLARRGTGYGSGLGVYRWVVEAAIALLHRFRRLRIRWETRDDIHHTVVTLGCAVISRRRLRTALCREQGQAMRPTGSPARCIRTRS